MKRRKIQYNNNNNNKRERDTPNQLVIFQGIGTQTVESMNLKDFKKKKKTI